MPDCYFYAAAIHCEACGEAIAERIRREAPEVAAEAEALEEIGATDSERFPVGACESESDRPVHCGSCGEYLAHPLTAHGVRYAVAALSDFLRHGTGSADVLAEWAADLRSYPLRGFAAVICGAFEALQASPERADRFYRRRERRQRRRARRSARSAEALGVRS